jgi:hypothetical protein
VIFQPRVAKMVDLALSPVTKLVSESESVRAQLILVRGGPLEENLMVHPFVPIPARPRLLVCLVKRWAVGGGSSTGPVELQKSSRGGFLGDKFQTDG